MSVGREFTYQMTELSSIASYAYGPWVSPGVIPDHEQGIITEQPHQKKKKVPFQQVE